LVLNVHFVSFCNNSSNEWAVCNQRCIRKRMNTNSLLSSVATSHANGCRFVSYILAIILSFYILSSLFILMERRCAFYAGWGSSLPFSTLIIYIAPRTKENPGNLSFLSSVRPVTVYQVTGVRGVYWLRRLNVQLLAAFCMVSLAWWRYWSWQWLSYVLAAKVTSEVDAVVVAVPILHHPNSSSLLCN